MEDNSGRINGVKHALDSKTCPSSFPTVKTKYYKNAFIYIFTSFPDANQTTPTLSSEIGNRHDDVTIKEAGDGNLNFVYIVVATCASFIIQQALTYERCIGESLSMIIEGECFEAVTSKEHGGLCHEYVPQLDHLDRTIEMQCSEAPHTILRKGLITAIQYRILAEHMFEYMVDSLFYGSLPYRPTTEHKCAVAECCGNVELCRLSEQIYKEWRLNRIEPTWVLFHQKLNKDDSGKAYRPAIYNLIQEEYMKELFHDTLGFGVAKMIRRIGGVDHVEDFESNREGSIRADSEAKALELANSLLKEKQQFLAIGEVISPIMQVQS
ncbi:hypothetical protein J1N35_043018 [Gossypium stocksii]|uniref:Uncharacterized protein n=1 Tax=Gossypium stocksii TaxID=47602 RepID=A0A9D3ZEL6_9ROSI|nr:hypothetical protein J1N35_043018 [Gossypium stocksii]